VTGYPVVSQSEQRVRGVISALLNDSISISNKTNVSLPVSMTTRSENFQYKSLHG
jgi:hypothetical protein